ncbi:MAG: prepilin-type N-terminal cleavage/methylation domain-containing protein [Sporolactobacillus sp.]
MLKKIMQKANAKKNQKGFTLIELLAVIVILAILAAIAIPSIISIIHKQNDKAEVQDALTVIHAAKLYVADNNVDTPEDISASTLNSYVDKTGSSVASGYTVHVTFNDDNQASYSISGFSLPSGITSDVISGTDGPDDDVTTYSESALLTFNKK